MRRPAPRDKIRVVHFRAYRLLGAAAAAAVLLLGTTLPGCRDTTGPTRIPAANAKPDLTFTQDGQTIAIIDGRAYKVRALGELEFLQELYDPDFYNKNYRVNNGQVYQVDPDSGQQYPVTTTYRDDFENLAQLLTPAGWHNNNTDPARAGKADNYYNLGNRITLSQSVTHSGAASLKFLARPSATSVSKASLVKNIMYFKKGDHVYYSGWFFLEPTPSIYDVGGFTLIDLESSFMQSVGLRVIFRRADALAFELELPKTQFNQDVGAEVSFPTGQWVHVGAHVLLSDDAGFVQIFQDGNKVLDKPGRTLPLADTVYDRVEIGVTAMGKGARYEKVLYVDDFVISDSPIP